MARPCPLHPSAPVKGAAYALTSDGKLHRLTRHQLLTGNLPPETAEVLTGVYGSLSPADAATARHVVHLTPQEVAEALNTKRRTRYVLTAGTDATVETTLADPYTKQPKEFECQGTVHSIGGRSIVFGAPEGSTWGDGVELLPRNPFVLSGLSPDSPQGRDLGLRYTAAVAAVQASVCRSCGTAHTCPQCQLHPLREQRAQVAGLLGKGSDAKPDTTVVDALVVLAASGDQAAAIELKALGAVGEQMISRTKERITSQAITTTEREKALAMTDGDFHAWYDEAFQTRHVDVLRAIDEDQQGLWEKGNSGEWSSEMVSAHAMVLAERRAQANAVLRAINEVKAIRRNPQLKDFSIDDIYLVHETDWPVERDADGNVVLHPLGDWHPETYRPTLHFALNNVVSGNIGRPSLSGGTRIVVPLSEVIAANPGALDNLYVIDTFLTPPPGEPLRLPGAFVFETTGEVGEFLQERSAPIFPMGQHYSEESADAAVRGVARELGVASALHANTSSYQYETMFQSRENQAGHLPPMNLDPSFLADCSDNHRLRMVSHESWGGVSLRPKSAGSGLW